MTRYRVRYEKIKPGGHREQQDASVHGDWEDLTKFIDENVKLSKYCIVTAYYDNDSQGHDETHIYGWRETDDRRRFTVQ